MKYKILEGDKGALEAQVNEHLNDGWHLHGSAYHANSTHYQPVSSGLLLETLSAPMELHQSEPAGPLEHTHIITLDASGLEAALDAFLIKFSELKPANEPAAPAETKQPKKEEKAK